MIETKVYVGLNDADTLALSFFDVEREVIEEIARGLCAFFHQESVLIAESTTTTRFVHEEL